MSPPLPTGLKVTPTADDRVRVAPKLSTVVLPTSFPATSSTLAEDTWRSADLLDRLAARTAEACWGVVRPRAAGARLDTSGQTISESAIHRAMRTFRTLRAGRPGLIAHLQRSCHAHASSRRHRAHAVEAGVMAHMVHLATKRTTLLKSTPFGLLGK